MDRIESLVYGILANLQGYKSEVGGKDEVGDYTVSTVNTLDAGWETAIWKGNGTIVVVARYATKEEALQKSYRVADMLSFEGKYFRRDIGFDL